MAIKLIPHESIIDKYYSYLDGNLYTKQGKLVGWQDTNGYRCVKLEGKVYLLHRVLWMYFHGTQPPEIIDHIDRNKLNNKMSNLRPTTNRGNMRNNGRASPCIRIEPKTGKFSVSTHVHNKAVSFGLYKDLEAAQKVLDIVTEHINNKQSIESLDNPNITRRRFNSLYKLNSKSYQFRQPRAKRLGGSVCYDTSIQKWRAYGPNKIYLGVYKTKAEAEKAFHNSVMENTSKI